MRFINKNTRSLNKNRFAKINLSTLIPNARIVGWGVVGVFIVFQVFFTIQTATTGAVLADLENQEKELKKKNQSLSEELVQITSLTKVRENSETLGYTKPELTIYINTDESVAKLR